VNRTNVDIHPNAKVHASVEIGSYTVIGDGVSIARGCKIASNVSILGPTVIGEYNKIYASASIGSDPQHIDYAGGGDIIGDW